MDDRDVADRHWAGRDRPRVRLRRAAPRRRPARARVRRPRRAPRPVDRRRRRRQPVPRRPPAWHPEQAIDRRVALESSVDGRGLTVAVGRARGPRRARRRPADRTAAGDAVWPGTHRVRRAERRCATHRAASASTSSRSTSARMSVMRAVVISEFGVPATVREVAPPTCPDDGVVLRVTATGVCRCDWHGWQGHDDDITLPHVPGHELAGVVVEVGRAGPVAGRRATTSPCRSCARAAVRRRASRASSRSASGSASRGSPTTGSFAELVAIHHADVNLVRLPDGMSPVTAAGLGCRFATAYRAVTVHGRVRAGRVGRGARLRRSRTVGGHGRRRRRCAGRRRRRVARRPRRGPRDGCRRRPGRHRTTSPRGSTR